jgi:hypothetical protein
MILRDNQVQDFRLSSTEEAPLQFLLLLTSVSDKNFFLVIKNVFLENCRKVESINNLHIHIIFVFKNCLVFVAALYEVIFVLQKALVFP